MKRPCTCELPTCHLCWLYHNRADYHNLWNGIPQGPSNISPEPRTEPCIHLGDSIRTELCPTCAGTVKVKIFSCSVHKECTLGKYIENIHCCGTCSEYKVQSPIGE